jgi:hypothetical protein
MVLAAVGRKPDVEDNDLFLPAAGFIGLPDQAQKRQ